MKNKLKLLIRFITKIYIPTCIKGHSFLLNKISNNSLILDIGMNQGEFTKFIKIKKNNVKVSAVELDKNLSLEVTTNKNTKVYNKAITGYDGFTFIYKIKHRFNYDYFGSLWSTVKDNDWDILETKKIECTSLDTFIENSFNNFEINKVDLLKIDIEGAELDALISIKKKNFDNIKQITLEFHNFMFLSQNKDVQKIINFLKENNFYFYDFSLEEKYRDVLFVNKKVISVFRNFFLVFLSSNHVKKMVKIRKGPFKYFLFLYRDYLSD